MSDAPEVMVEHYRDQERQRILAMEPGREMDAEVAVKVMEYEISKLWEGCAKEKGRSVAFPIPKYSTNITAAWEVVEKHKQVQITITVMNTAVHCEINAGFNRRADVTEKTTPEAICKAALLAINSK